MSKSNKNSESRPRPWKKVHSFNDFLSADKKRNDLLQNENLSVKVKRMADGTFVVKIRPSEAPPAKKSKKNKSKQ